MAKKSKQPDTQSNTRSFWRKRASFRVGKTRRQRRAQLRDQTNALIIIGLAVVILGGLVIYLNWRGVGATKSASCENYPQYCVPLAGGLTGRDEFLKNESPDVRTIDAAQSEGANGVVRGFHTDISVPFLGNPDAPIHFITVSDFACGHCQEFHETDLMRFWDDYVLTGQATFGFALATGTGREYSELASQGALCAGEQGAFWEMQDELFRLARSMAVSEAFTLTQIQTSANKMGLDGDQVRNCTASARYQSLVISHRNFANDHGVTGTPTVLVSYGKSGVWSKLDGRSYDYLKSLTEAAAEQAAPEAEQEAGPQATEAATEEPTQAAAEEATPEPAP